MIPLITIERIKDAAQIYDVVSEFVSLKRRGVNYVGLCPFHADKNPSFYVSPTKNFCKCFSCGEGGDPVRFLMKKENLSFIDAIRWLGKKYGIEIEEREMTAEEKQRQTDREGMFAINEDAQKIFEDDLYNSEEGRNVGLAYFRERGLQDETIKRFHLGYALNSKRDLPNRLMSKGYDPKYLVDQTGVGLCFYPSGKNGDPNTKRKPMCRFAGRVIFPHHSLSGKCIAFGGRILQRVDHAFKKYVNSPESLIYHKSDLPYGLYEAGSDIRKSDLCYVVEGNVDVLSMSQAGFRNVIAASGTSLTREHIRVVKRLTKNVILMFDGDKAGVTAALKSIDLLLMEDMTVRILQLPEGEDPDSFCRKNAPEVVEQYFKDHQVDFITYKTRILLQQIPANDIIAKGAVVQDVANSISLIPNPIMCGMLARQLSQMCNVPEPNVMQAINQAKQSKYQEEVKRQQAEIEREIALRELSELEVGDEPENAETSETTETSKPEQPEHPDANEPEPQEPAATTATAPQATPTQATPTQTKPTQATQATPAIRAEYPTDKYEQQLIRDIVRHGGEYFELSGYNEKGQTIKQSCRVIDYIYNELNADGLTFNHPLYARMYQISLDASADPSVQWDSIRFFLEMHSDPEVQQMAITLMEDRYEGLGVAENNEHLEVVLPRNVLELKACIISMQLKYLQWMLSQPNVDTEAVMKNMCQLQIVKRNFDKALGGRIITN